MQSHTLTVLGMEVSFKAQADPGRIEKAKELLEERYEKLTRHGGQANKEKLLTFLALALADDVLQMEREKVNAEVRVKELLVNMEKAAEGISA